MYGQSADEEDGKQGARATEHVYPPSHPHVSSTQSHIRHGERGQMTTKRRLTASPSRCSASLSQTTPDLLAPPSPLPSLPSAMHSAAQFRGEPHAVHCAKPICPRWTQHRRQADGRRGRPGPSQPHRCMQPPGPSTRPLAALSVALFVSLLLPGRFTRPACTPPHCRHCQTHSPIFLFFRLLVLGQSQRTSVNTEDTTLRRWRSGM